MVFLKKQIPLLIALVTGIIFIIQFFVPHPASQNLQAWVTKWISIVTGTALLLGLTSLIYLHYQKVKNKTTGWGFSLVVFLGVFISLMAGFLPTIINWLTPSPVLTAGMTKGSPLIWIFNNSIAPLQASMFSLIAFFMASASFRAFRIKNIQATVLLVSAMIIMLGQIPLGGLISSAIPDTMTWILTVPNIAVRRAILFGVTLGAIATSLKIIFGIEQSYLGSK
ncbi:MAG: hypothetical protein KAS70_02195 [Planctomycetes bacterium]|nr:hypothetical protein [Planctomycetota bacterium]